MKNRNSFLLYMDWEKTFIKIGKYESGDLIQGIFKYMRTGEIPEFESFIVETVFGIFLETFKRDNDKYKKVCERNTINGAKKWNNDGINKNATGKSGKKNYAKNADSDNDNDSDSDSGNDNDSDIDNINNLLSISSSPAVKDRAASGAYTEDFLEFWNAYPRKTGKGAAFRSWLKIRPTKKERADIMSALEWQKSSSQWNDSGYGKFIPLPATYINQRRWEDEPDSSDSINIARPDKYLMDEDDSEALKLLEKYKD